MNMVQHLLAKVFREDTLESFHQGHIAVVDRRGKVIYSYGDPHFFTFIRSAAKPLQAITVLESGAVTKYGLTNEEIALMCSSHSGQQAHVAVGEEFLKKLGLTEKALGCGSHLPKDVMAAKNLLAAGKEPGPLHNNCSGKHLGMLALALHRGYSLEDYFERNHPVQQEMLRIVARYCNLKFDSFELGTDGCGVPVFAMPISNMAFSYAELVRCSKEDPVIERVVKSMQDFPHLVAGTNRLCTDLMSVTKGKLIAKVGTEAVYCIGLLEQELGIAVKITDGNLRALGPVVIEILKQLGVLTSKELEQLDRWHTRELLNHRQQRVGKIVPSFKLI